jgi:tight adherence protein B
VRGRSRSAEWDPESLSDALDIVASALRAGLPPAMALTVAREATVWGRCEAERVARVVESLDQGAATASAWLLTSDEGAAADAYGTVGGVWDLALQTGGPLAEAVDYLGDHLREQARLHGRLEALAAGPRASARLLTLLPLVGPALAVLVGADPRDLYLSSAAAGASAVIGLVLTAVGWRWSRAMVVRAARPRRYLAGGPRGQP